MAKSKPGWSEKMTGSDAGQAGSPLSEELSRLEEIVRRLESEELELDAALELFEEGVVRLRAARDRLTAAELKVQAVLAEAGSDIRFTKLDA
jgi:exodeoxyribonuclease VII small subunit